MRKILYLLVNCELGSTLKLAIMFGTDAIVEELIKIGIDCKEKMKYEWTLKILQALLAIAVGAVCEKPN